MYRDYLVKDHNIRFKELAKRYNEALRRFQFTVKDHCVSLSHWGMLYYTLTLELVKDSGKTLARNISQLNENYAPVKTNLQGRLTLVYNREFSSLKAWCKVWPVITDQQRKWKFNLKLYLLSLVKWWNEAERCKRSSPQRNGCNT